MDITELVKRAFDTRPGGEGEANMARDMLRSRLFDNEKTRDLRIWHGDSQSSDPNIMDLLAEYKRPIELKIAQLERDIKRKDRQIAELTAHTGDGTTFDTLESMIRQRDEEITRLTSQVIALTIEKVRTPRTQRSVTTDSSFTWTSTDYREAVSLMMQKKGIKGVMERFPNSRSGQVDGKLRNQAPDEKLLGHPIPVLEAGPMDFLEFWKIGHSLYGQGWRKEIERRFNITARGIGFDPPTYLSEQQRQILRDNFRHPSRLQRLGAKATEILERIRAAGEEGIAIETGEGHQRLTELRDKKLIFDSGRRGGKLGRSIIWAATKEKDSFPD